MTIKASLWLVGLFVLSLVTMSGRALGTVPPEWLFCNYLYHSVAQTPGFVIEAPMEQTSGDFVINIPVEERTKRKALATLLVAHIDGLEEGASIRVVDGRGCVQEPLDIRGTTNQPIFSIPKWHGEFCPERMECFRQVRRAHGRAFPDWSTYSCQ